MDKLYGELIIRFGVYISYREGGGDPPSKARPDFEKPFLFIKIGKTQA